MFEGVLTENYAQLFEGESVLVKSRLALMLGHYLKGLFESNGELFARSIEFLLKGIATEKTHRALALQCADTLKTIIGDDDMVSRLDSYIGRLFPLLCEMTGTVDLPTFYEVLGKVIDCYAPAIDTDLGKLLEGLVRRVVAEHQELRARGEKNNMTINQCWNVIRAICEQTEFFPACADTIENALLPMFNYLVEPKYIDFDDDMMQVIASLISKRGDITPNMAKLFPVLPNFFAKYSNSFGSLLPTLNAYLFYGKTMFAQNKEWVELVVKLFAAALYSTREVVPLNNAEGAVLAQILLQSVGGGLLDPYIPVIVDETVKRLAVQPSADYLSRQLYNVILCAACNNATVTISRLELQGCTEAVLNGIFEAGDKYQHTYDIKVLVIGLANIMMQPVLPTTIAKSLTKIMELIVAVLQRQAANDATNLAKADKKSLAVVDSDDEDDKDNASNLYPSMQVHPSL